MVISLGALMAFVAIVDESISFGTTIGESMSSTVLWTITVIVIVSVGEDSGSLNTRSNIIVIGGDICVGSQLNV